MKHFLQQKSHKILQNSKNKTVRNFTELYTTMQKQTKAIHNSTKLYTILQRSTR
jgi:hypothetical protein